MPAAATDPPPLHFGPFVLDRAAGRLLRQGQTVEIAPRPWAVLLHLAERPGRLVSKDDLLDAIWGHRHVSDSVLKVAINAVRQALSDDAAAPRFVETVARRGYRFVAAVQEAGPAPSGSTASPAAGIADVQPAAAPPEPAGSAGNLAAPVAALVGRDAALQALRALLATGRLVTVLGPGGVGKTQLALATARLDPPADGVWLLRLDALQDATPLLDTVARTLALGANASRSTEALARALAPLRLRLVLDNAEHLVDAVAALATQCLAQAPQVQLLVTSQSPLRVAGEVLLPLQPLEAPPEASAADPLDFPSVHLFVTRARAAQPGYAPDAAALADIGAICRLLDGLPLAIELAAARVPLLGAAGVRARIGDRFALLSRGARDAPERHRTLRAALEWSFGLLDAADARVLQRLSVFAGSFTPALAHAVAGEPGDADWQTLDTLQTLQDHSLLATDGGQGAPRLRLLESVRALAAERLRASGDDGATRTRLAQALGALFGSAQAQYTRTPLLHWLQPLRPEADNLRVAMAHALALLPAEAPVPPAAAPAGLPLAVSLFSRASFFWLRSGRKREAQMAYDALAPFGPLLQDAALRAPFGLALGALAAYGQSLPPADAMPWLADAEADFVRLGDPRSAMLSLYLHAALSQRVAPTQDRTPLLARMRALEQPDWSPRERNFAGWTEAVNAHGHGDLATFRDFCAADLLRARAADDQAQAAIAAFGLGQALWTGGARTEAMATLVQTVDALRGAGLLREYATTAALAASMQLMLAPAQQGLAACREAADLLRAEGMLWWMGDALMMLPAQRGDWAAALRLQAWIDGRMQALGMQRSPVANSLRETFDTLLGQARQQAGWHAPACPPASALDDAEVLRLAFG